MKGTTHAVRRLFELWGVYAKMDLVWLTRDAKATAVYVLSDVILNVAAITTTLLLAERFNGIGQWTKHQVVFMLGYAMLVNVLLDALFGFNIEAISRRIGRGQLDHMLVQPQPLWMLLATEGFTPVEYPLVFAIACALLIWSGRRLALVVSPGWLLLFALNVLASTIIVLSFQFIWGSLAFWAPRAAEEINSSTHRMITQLKPFPLDGVSPVLLGSMLTVIPAGFTAWYPTRSLLGIGHGAVGFVLTPIAAALFAALAVWLFKKGLHEYARTGSQRYLSYGHRR